MSATEPASGAPPLVIANPAARRGRAGGELGSMFEALRAALGPLDGDKELRLQKVIPRPHNFPGRGQLGPEEVECRA